MRIKKSYFYIICMFLFIFSVFDSALSVGTITTQDKSYYDNYKNIVTDSVGNLYCAWIIDMSANPNPEGNITISKSTDNGITWTNYKFIVGYYNRRLTMVIDDNDIIYITYVTGDSIAARKAMLYLLNTKNDTLYGYKIIASGTIEIPDISLTVDSDNNIHIIYGVSFTPTWHRLYYLVYTYALKTWSSPVIIQEITGVASSKAYFYLNIRCTDDMLYIAFIQTIGTTGLYYSSAIKGSDFDTPQLLLSSSIYNIYSMVMELDIVGNAHISYSATSSDSNGKYAIFYMTNKNDFSEIITVYLNEDYNQYLPTISITNENIIAISWYGTTNLLPNYNLLCKFIYGDVVSDLVYLLQTSDTCIYPMLMYQNYPLYMTDDNILSFIYKNDTTKDIIFNTYVIDINATSDLYPTQNTIYLKLFDKSTGKQLYYKGIESTANMLFDYTKCYIKSSYFISGYGKTSFQLTDSFPVTFNFSDGSYITLTFSGTIISNTNFTCNVNNKDVYFKYQTISLKMYAGQTYNIYLEPTSYVDGVEYSNCGVDLTGWGAYCCLNKQEYSIGETLRLEYKLPPESWLNINNYGVTGYQLKVYNKDDYFLGQRLTGLIKTPVILSYTQNDGEIILDGNRHTLEINVLADINEYGFDEFFNDYEIVIETYDYGIFQGWKIIDRIFFYVNGLTYLPNGTINSITPNPCYMGQEASIAWQSNGNGYIEICYPNGHVYYRQPYGYSSGVHTLTKTITAIGTLAVNLYTNSLLYNNTLPVDTDTLICTPLGTNGTYGSYGYGVPYLYIPSYRGIAGYDTIYIYYRTYKNDSILNVTSPRQEQTFFSTTVSNQSDNVLAIPLEPYMQIGVWNVTLTGGDISGNTIVLSSSFNIVNEEGNWVEFTKNVYNTNEVFSLFIKHTYRISLTFYKDDIAQGESLIYEIGENDNTIVNIEKSLIALMAGNWRVEMYRINDRNIVELLAEDICMVEYAKAIDEPLNIDFIGVIPAPIKLLIGIIIPVIFALIPLLVTASLSRKGKDIDNLELICVAFFFFGMFISIMLTFLPVASIFIVLLGVIVTFALMYIQRKEG